MRLNTKELSLQRKFESNEEWSRYRRLLIENHDVAKIFQLGQRGDESLDDVELMRFNLILREHLRLTENQFDRVSLGHTSMGEWEQNRRQAAWMLRSPSALKLWEAWKYAYRPEFVAEIEQELTLRSRKLANETLSD